MPFPASTSTSAMRARGDSPVQSAQRASSPAWQAMRSAALHSPLAASASARSRRAAPRSARRSARSRRRRGRPRRARGRRAAVAGERVERVAERGGDLQARAYCAEVALSPGPEAVLEAGGQRGCEAVAVHRGVEARGAAVDGVKERVVGERAQELAEPRAVGALSGREDTRGERGGALTLELAGDVLRLPAGAGRLGRRHRLPAARGVRERLCAHPRGGRAACLGAAAHALRAATRRERGGREEEGHDTTRGVHHRGLRGSGSVHGAASSSNRG